MIKGVRPMIQDAISRRTAFFVVAIAFASISLSAGPSRAGEPLNVTMMNEVWAAYNDKIWESAIAEADELIDEFEPSAWATQQELSKGDYEPPLGTVTGKEKKQIYSLGPLHEVAAAWWVKGRSLEKLKNPEEALEAYKAAAKYTHSRVWDPSWSGFWAPGKDAKLRGARLKGQD